jgi:hypothetical protein
MIGPCEAWIDAEAVFDCGPCAAIPDDEQNATLAEQAAEAASELLYFWSGKRFPGECEATVAPCRIGNWCGQTIEGVPIAVYLDGCDPCTCGAYDPAACSCSKPPTIRLPGRVIEVSEVVVAGEVLDPGDYTVQEHRYLIRTDGGTWPVCQDLADPSFTVTYTRGQAPPASGVLAAKELACDFYKGCSGGDCSVPANVTNLVRQGVTMQFVRPTDIGLRDGVVHTGLRAVSMFLAAFPRRRPGGVASPDVRPAVRNL